MAANNYQGHPAQIEALIKLEKKINPYILSAFMNEYADHARELYPNVVPDTYLERTYGDFDR